MDLLQYTYKFMSKCFKKNSDDYSIKCYIGKTDGTFKAVSPRSFKHLDLPDETLEAVKLAAINSCFFCDYMNISDRVEFNLWCKARDIKTGKDILKSPEALLKLRQKTTNNIINLFL